MAEDSRRNSGKHKIVIEEREDITITGVEEVISFDEESIVCDTQMGVMVIRGSELHIARLDLEAGILQAKGNADSAEYTELSVFEQKGGLLKRIFR